MAPEPLTPDHDVEAFTSGAELIDLIRRKGDQVRGRIGTFDIERVGIGYLVWSHDNQRTASNGRLLELFATQEARLFTSSAAMLRALVRGISSSPTTCSAPMPMPGPSAIRC